MNHDEQGNAGLPATTGKARLKDKMAYGLGAVSDMIGFHGPTSLVGPIYIIHLGLSPGLVALALALNRAFDGCLDPVMGNISDNSTSKRGKRLPYILVGAILTGAALALLGQIPYGMSTWAAFAYLVFSMGVFYTCYTIYTVPYHALGYEITADYHDRTRVMSYRLFFNTLGGITAGWLLSLATSSYFENSLTGTAFACALAGVIFVVFGLIPGLGLKEQGSSAQGVGEIRSIRVATRAVASSRPFVILLLLAGGILVSGTMIMSSFLIYINTYYVFDGNLNKAASLQGVLVATSAVLSLAVIPLATHFSSKIDKIGVLYCAFGVQLLVGVLSWVGIQPGVAWPQVVLMSLYYASVSVYFLMMHSMVGDICDAAELETGFRREGMFGAAITWTQKMAVAISIVLSGLILQWAGFKSGQDAVQDPATLTTMRAAFSTVLIVQPVLSIILLRRYPLRASAVRLLQEQLVAKRRIASTSPALLSQGGGA